VAQYPEHTLNSDANHPVLLMIIIPWRTWCTCLAVDLRFARILIADSANGLHWSTGVQLHQNKNVNDLGSALYAVSFAMTSKNGGRSRSIMIRNNGSPFVARRHLSCCALSEICVTQFKEEWEVTPLFSHSIFLISLFFSLHSRIRLLLERGKCG